MDENSNNTAKETENTEKKHLTKPTKAAFLLLVCVLSLLYSSGQFGVPRIALMLAASAMNVLLLLGFGDSKPKLALVLLVNILPFAAASVYMSSVVAALGALYPLVMAVPIWLTIRTGNGRSASIALAAVCAMVVWCVGFVNSVVSELGAFNAQTLGALLDGVFEPYAQYISDMMKDENGKPLIYITTANLEMMRYYFKTLFFGTVGVVMLVWAYFATLATRLLAKIFGVEWQIPGSYRIGFRAKLTEKGPQVEVTHELVPWRIQLDNVTVAVYITSYIMAVLFAPSDGLLLTLYTVVINLILILSPGFLYCGLRDVILGFRRRSTSGFMGYVVLVLGLIMVFISPAAIAFMLCALGVIVTLRENRMRKNTEKLGKE